MLCRLGNNSVPLDFTAAVFGESLGLTRVFFRGFFFPKKRSLVLPRKRKGSPFFAAPFFFGFGQNGRTHFFDWLKGGCHFFGKMVEGIAKKN